MGAILFLRGAWCAFAWCADSCRLQLPILEKSLCSSSMGGVSIHSVRTAETEVNRPSLGSSKRQLSAAADQVLGTDLDVLLVRFLEAQGLISLPCTR